MPPASSGAGALTGAPIVGVLGASGRVGQAAVRELEALGTVELRLARRRAPTAGEASSARAPLDVFDMESHAALQRFCDGCCVVLNCAGPSHRFLDRAARAALKGGAHYVDAAGDEPAYCRLSEPQILPAGTCVVLSAGMMPGLSALLPRHLARTGLRRIMRLTAYVGGLDRFTPAAAADYLASLDNGYGHSLSCWSDGRRASGRFAPLHDVDLPFFPDPVSAHPFLSAETERLIRALRIENATWYNVYAAGGTLRLLGSVHAALESGASMEAAAAELVTAAELDLAGRTPYQLLVFELEGESVEGSTTRSLALRGRDSYQLSGAVAAHAVWAVIRGEVPPGLHFAAEVLDPGATVKRLQESDAVAAFELLDGPLVGRALERGAV
jgi:saccharopine dehydrogenase-like protein